MNPLCPPFVYVCVSSSPPPPPRPFSQNQDQLKEPDNDFFNGDGNLTFTFGDTSITANGASGGGSGGGAGGGDGGANRTAWSANGKRSASTSEEALEPELDSHEQELLSRGTRLVLTMEDQA